MGSHRLRETPDLGDFKSPRAEPRKPQEPKPAAPDVPANDASAAPGTSEAATPFQLSRIYAKGWQAGMNSAIETADFDTVAAANALNPCTVATERERWAQGFSEAIARKIRVPGRKPVAFRASVA